MASNDNPVQGVEGNWECGINGPLWTLKLIGGWPAYDWVVIFIPYMRELTVLGVKVCE